MLIVITLAAIIGILLMIKPYINHIIRPAINTRYIDSEISLTDFVRITFIS